MEKWRRVLFLLIFLFYSFKCHSQFCPGFGTGRYARLDRFCSRRGITIRFIRNLQPAESGEGAERIATAPSFPSWLTLKMRQWTSDGRAEPSTTAKPDQHIRFFARGWDFVNWPHRRAILHHSTEVLAP